MQRTLVVLGATVAMAFAFVTAPTVVMQADQAFAGKKKCKGRDAKKGDSASSVIAKYTVTKGKTLDASIEKSLTGKPGDAKKGLATMVHRRMGNCIACHKVAKINALAKPGDLKSQGKYGFHGDIGPELDGVAGRYSEGELRMLVVDPKKVFPDTIMPAFHKGGGYTRIFKDCKGTAMMSPDDIEDVVAYLKTLK